MSGERTRVYEGEWIVTSMLIDRADRFGEATAVTSKAGDVSWRGLVERAARVGGFLQHIGVKPGDRVATMLPSTIEYMAAWHGIAWCNGIDVPINNEYKGAFLEHMLRDSGAKVVVIDARWVDRLREIDVPDLEHIIALGGADEAGVEGRWAVHQFEDALSADAAPLVARSETDLTYIMYTSGTTGPAKGVVHNNRSSIWYAMPFIEGLDLTDEDVCYSMFPLFHQMGRSACSTAAWYVGNPVVLRERFSASGFWDDIRESGATWMGYFGAVILFLWNNEPGRVTATTRCGERSARLRRPSSSNHGRNASVSALPRRTALPSSALVLALGRGTPLASAARWVSRAATSSSRSLTTTTNPSLRASWAKLSGDLASRTRYSRGTGTTRKPRWMRGETFGSTPAMLASSRTMETSSSKIGSRTRYGDEVRTSRPSRWKSPSEHSRACSRWRPTQWAPISRIPRKRS